MRNPFKRLLLGLAPLLFSSLCPAGETVHFINGWDGFLNVRVGWPEREGKKIKLSGPSLQLTVEALQLDPESGQYLHTGTRRFDLASQDPPGECLLSPGYAFGLSCNNLPDTPVTVPLRVTGRNPIGGGTFTFGLIFSCTATTLTTREATLVGDPIYNEVLLPFRVTQMGTTDTPDEELVCGIKLVPPEGGETHYRFKSIRNLSSIVSMDPLQQPCTCCGFTCCDCCTCACCQPDGMCVIL